MNVMSHKTLFYHLLELSHTRTAAVLSTPGRTFEVPGRTPIMTLKYSLFSGVASSMVFTDWVVIVLLGSNVKFLLTLL